MSFRPATAERTHVIMSRLASPAPGVRAVGSPEMYDGARHRALPECFVVDRELAVLMATTVSVQSGELPPAIAEMVSALVASANGDLTTLSGSEIVDGKLVRVAPMTGPNGACLGVFVETLRGRDAVASAIERYGLSNREADVMNCLSFGERTKGIAKSLGISEATVSDHVKSIMAKMNCHSRTQLLARVFGPS